MRLFFKCSILTVLTILGSCDKAADAKAASVTASQSLNAVINHYEKVAVRVLSHDKKLAEKANILMGILRSAGSPTAFESAMETDSTTRSLISNVSALFQQVLQDTRMERDLDQNQLLTDLGNFWTCNTLQDQSVASFAGEVATLNTTHVTCRAQELVDYNYREQECGLLETFLSGLTPPVCVKPTTTRQYKDDFLSFAQNGLDWFTPNLATFDPLASSCEGAITTHATQRGVCEQGQYQLELKYCEWWDAEVQRCQAQIACYMDKWNTYTDFANMTYPMSVRRAEVAVMISMIECQLTQLLAGMASNITYDVIMDTCKYVMSADFSEYLNYFPDIPVRQRCHVEHVAIYPGLAEWQDFAYPDIDANTPPVVDNLNCHTTTTFNPEDFGIDDHNNWDYDPTANYSSGKVTDHIDGYNETGVHGNDTLNSSTSDLLNDSWEDWQNNNTAYQADNSSSYAWNPVYSQAPKA